MAVDERVSGLSSRLASLNTRVLSDVLDEAGFPNQVLSSALRPLAPGMTIAGPAVGVTGQIRVATSTSVAPEKRPSSFALDRRQWGGAIAVIDTGGYHAGAVIGGFMAMSLKRQGCRGLVVDGAIRDADEVVETGLPAFVRSVTPINGSRRWELTAIDVPVRLPGQTTPAVEIRSGDLILGDSDGVVVVPQEHADEIVAAAEELCRVEARILARMQGGAGREEAFSENPRFKHIRRLRP